MTEDFGAPPGNSFGTDDTVDWLVQRPEDPTVAFPAPSYQSGPQAGYQAPASIGRLGPDHERRGASLAMVSAVTVLVIVIAAVGYVAYRQNSVANKWRARAQEQASISQTVTANLNTANESIEKLNVKVITLNGRVGALQSKVSTVANEKEKALDQNAVLTQLTQQATTVTQQLSTCVDDMNGLLNEISNDLSGQFDDPNLETSANIANEDCTSAQEANQHLQNTLSGAG